MGVTTPSGFVAAGVHCGIKASGAPDLAIVATADGRPVPTAAVFTQNLACAGPVRVSREHLAATGGRVAAVVLNSGNANCATATSIDVAREMCALTAKEIGCAVEEVLVCSTGLIGITLPPEPLRSGIPAVAAARRADGGTDAAQAILTTDTRRKEVVAAGAGFAVGGMAKGAAMLAPNMATMLAVLTTDAATSAATLQEILREAVNGSFNRLTVDGCTSTNDTVIVMASGNGDPISAGAVDEACLSLARQMAGDAEGHTKVVTVEIVGAASPADADRAARKVAQSQLVKCSWYGEDPYWGRILSELGTSGAAMKLDATTIAYDGCIVSRGGIPVAHDEVMLATAVQAPAFTVTCDLGAGPASTWLLTNDLTHAYIDENRGTS